MESKVHVVAPAVTDMPLMKWGLPPGMVRMTAIASSMTSGGKRTLANCTCFLGMDPRLVGSPAPRARLANVGPAGLDDVSHRHLPGVPARALGVGAHPPDDHRCAGVGDRALAGHPDFADG